MKNIQYSSSRAVVRYLRSVRIRRNYSQEFVAEKLGISQEAYSRLELHETTPSIDRIFQIGRILGIPPKDLVITI